MTAYLKTQLKIAELGKKSTVNVATTSIWSELFTRIEKS